MATNWVISKKNTKRDAKGWLGNNEDEIDTE
jgi:hypothetical protein